MVKSPMSGDKPGVARCPACQGELDLSTVDGEFDCPWCGAALSSSGALLRPEANRKPRISPLEWVVYWVFGVAGWIVAIPVISVLLFLGALTTRRQQKLAGWTLLWASAGPLWLGLFWAGLKLS
jgi:predicted RNA-binding Zn-ribbon protein involved in translation (DUF1610 family)